jgi:hypothetical protein
MNLKVKPFSTLSTITAAELTILDTWRVVVVCSFSCKEIIVLLHNNFKVPVLERSLQLSENKGTGKPIGSILKTQPKRVELVNKRKN